MTIIDTPTGTVDAGQALGPNTHLIPRLGSAWADVDFVSILSKPTAFLSVSQNNSLYSPDGAQSDERQWERGSLEKTIPVVHAARALGARFAWVGYEIFRSGYPQNPMDAAQFSTWEKPFAEWSAQKRTWDGELTPALRELVEPGDLELNEVGLQSSFIGTSLDAYLKREGIRTLVITGIHLDWCIEGNARVARDLGYMPIVVGDATACERRQDEAAAMRRINNYFAPVLSSDAVVSLMNQAAGRKRAAA